jgi:hypothetical protein
MRGVRIDGALDKAACAGTRNRVQRFLMSPKGRLAVV